MTSLGFRTAYCHVSDRLYTRGAVGGEGQKKRQSLMALPLLKSLVFKMCLELPPGHAGQTNQAQAEKQHRHRLGSRGRNQVTEKVQLKCRLDNISLREEDVYVVPACG